jgi:diguanylate cyclase (GGDEF)-like protein
MTKFNSQFKKYKRTKILQAILTVFLAVCCFVPLNVPQNIFIILLIVENAIFIYVDFAVYAKALEESDDIKRTAYMDELTGMPNRYSCDVLFSRYATEQSMQKVGCALIVIDNLMAINDQFGREAGNQVIIDFSQMLEEIGEEFGFVGRNGGNEFLLVIEKCTAQQMEDFFAQLNTRLKRYNVLTLNNPIAIRYGYALNAELHFTNFSEIITEVYSKVHLGKYNIQK